MEKDNKFQDQKDQRSDVKNPQTKGGVVQTPNKGIDRDLDKGSDLNKDLGGGINQDRGQAGKKGGVTSSDDLKDKSKDAQSDLNQSWSKGNINQDKDKSR